MKLSPLRNHGLICSNKLSAYYLPRTLVILSPRTSIPSFSLLLPDEFPPREKMYLSQSGSFHYGTRLSGSISPSYLIIEFHSSICYEEDLRTSVLC